MSIKTTIAIAKVKSKLNIKILRNGLTVPDISNRLSTIFCMVLRLIDVYCIKFCYQINWMDTLKKTLTFVGIVLFPFSLPLPLPLKFSSICFIIFSLTLLLKINFKKFRIQNYWILLCLIYFFIDFLIPILFLDFNRASLNDTKLVFLVVPIIFFNSREFLKQKKDLILRSFVVGVVVYVFYAWQFAFYFYNFKYPERYFFSLTDGYILYMFYNYLPGAIHHTYIGLYIIIAICILFKFKLINKLISILLIITLSFSLFFIGGKITMLLLFINFVYFFIFHRVFHIKKILALFSVSALGLFFVKDWIIYSFYSSLSGRFEYYYCGLKSLNSNFLSGVGFQNIKSLSSFCSNLSEVFIPHNVFLYEILSNGFIGLLLLIIIYVCLTRIFIKNKDYIFNIIILNLFAISLIEDVIHLQRGALFFIPFLSLIYFTKILKINTIKKLKNT